MKASGKYDIDRLLILRKAYNLLCLFFANKEISRRSDPNDDMAPLKALEHIFLINEASRLLLEIAVAVRVIDDQMRKIPVNHYERVQYELRKAEADKLS